MSVLIVITVSGGSIVSMLDALLSRYWPDTGVYTAITSVVNSSVKVTVIDAVPSVRLLSPKMFSSSSMNVTVPSVTAFPSLSVTVAVMVVGMFITPIMSSNEIVGLIIGFSEISLSSIIFDSSGLVLFIAVVVTAPETFIMLSVIFMLLELNEIQIPFIRLSSVGVVVFSMCMLLFFMLTLLHTLVSIAYVFGWPLFWSTLGP